MNFALFNDLVTRYNQINQKVDTTAHCPVTTINLKLLINPLTTNVPTI